MKWLTNWHWAKTLAVLAALVVVIQFVPYGVSASTAHDEPRWDSPRTRQLFMAACGDCHSSQTKVLWFERAAPVKWYVGHHVEEGRAALNVSTWHSAAGRGLDDLTKVIKDGSMPISSYTYFNLHSDARLTDAQRRQLIDGLNKTVRIDPPTESRGGHSGEGRAGDGD